MDGLCDGKGNGLVNGPCVLCISFNVWWWEGVRAGGVGGGFGVWNRSAGGESNVEGRFFLVSRIDLSRARLIPFVFFTCMFTVRFSVELEVLKGS